MIMSGLSQCGSDARDDQLLQRLAKLQLLLQNQRPKVAENKLDQVIKVLDRALEEVAGADVKKQDGHGETDKLGNAIFDGLLGEKSEAASSDVTISIVSTTAPNAAATPSTTICATAAQPKHKVTPPGVCFMYNSGTKCRTSFGLGTCRFLHICGKYIVGCCSDALSCNLNHSYSTPDCVAVLTSHGITIDGNTTGDYVTALVKNFMKREIMERFAPTKADGVAISTPLRLCHVVFSDDGNLIVPEVCFQFLNLKCTADYQDKVCDRLHSQIPYFWQVSKDGLNWLNFGLLQSKALEKAFCDPNVSSMDLPALDPDTLQSRDNSSLLALLGGAGVRWSVRFSDMKLDLWPVTLHLRRLGLGDNEENWAWFWQDVSNNWIEYGGINAAGKQSSVTSSQIESAFKDRKKLPITGVLFTTPEHSYMIDFANMVQTNQQTNTNRAIQRRPSPRIIGNPFPSNWTEMTSNSCDKVLLDSTSVEYKSVAAQFGRTMVNRILQIYRIQNPAKWRQYCLKKEELAAKHNTALDGVDERQLFHGTNPGVVDSICKQNFDWRLHGSAVGSLLGCGVCFSNIASFSAGFCARSVSHTGSMFLAKVLVGKFQQGRQNLRRPDPIVPGDPFTLYDTTVDSVIDPTIFVKYYDGEYYPEYLIVFEG